MRYKIKIKTLNSGKKEHYVYVRRWWGWSIIDDFTNWHNLKFSNENREGALALIDQHYNNQVKSIEFEYVEKQ